MKFFALLKGNPECIIKIVQLPLPAKEVSNSWLFICLFDYANMKNTEKLGIGPTCIPFNFESDTDHRLDIKKCQRSGFFPFTFYWAIYKICHSCLGRGMNSPSALVFNNKLV